jgi:hypothetical protein
MTKDNALYARAKNKQKKGQELSLTERQRLDRAHNFRVAREEAVVKRAHYKKISDSQKGPRFVVTRHGQAVVIPNDHPGGPWSSKDELEIVTQTGKALWVTLVRLRFVGSDPRRSEWWSYNIGRQSKVVLHVAPPLAHTAPPVENKQAELLLDEGDLERVSTGAGAAYLAIRKKKSEQTKTNR